MRVRLGTILACAVAVPAVLAAPAWAPHDKTPPQTTITKGPSGRTYDRTPTFKFRSSERKSAFQCKRDGKPFRRCFSPLTVNRKLSYGRHGFYVRAIDRVGNVDRTPAGRLFKVVRR